MEVKQLIAEIQQCEKILEEYIYCYDLHENECPSSFKLIMLLNDWHSPFAAINELLKRIDTNEMLLKRAKKSGADFKYKSRYREMCSLVQSKKNGNERSITKGEELKLNRRLKNEIH